VHVDWRSQPWNWFTKNGGFCKEIMTNSFLRHNNGVDFGAANASSGGAGLTLANNLETHGAFTSSNDPKTTRQFLATYGTTFSNNVPSVGLRLKAPSSAPAGGELELNR
jgi:hypothetical protein